MLLLGEKPYLCVKCLKSFVSSGVLKAHIRTHAGVKEYICSLCKMMFTTNGSMKRHMTTHSEVLRPSQCGPRHTIALYGCAVLFGTMNTLVQLITDIYSKSLFQHFNMCSHGSISVTRVVVNGFLLRVFTCCCPRINFVSVNLCSYSCLTVVVYGLGSCRIAHHIFCVVRGD